jgi:hypothetical protein
VGTATIATIQSTPHGLGAGLFELVTGQPPFAGETPMAIAHQVIDEEPPKPSSIPSQRWEDAVWIALGVASLVLVVMSFQP